MAELAFKAGRLDYALRRPLQAEVAILVRLINCYYLNLIEGHATRLRDIAKAVEGDFSDDPAQRNKQLETNPDFDPRGAAILQAVFTRGGWPRGEAGASATEWAAPSWRSSPAQVC